VPKQGTIQAGYRNGGSARGDTEVGHSMFGARENSDRSSNNLAALGAKIDGPAPPP